jgi:hypothetical protein
MQLATVIETPELLAALKDFSLSQNGTDQQRNQAAIKVANAGLIEKSKVTLWVQGQWQEVMLLAYEFHNEPLQKHSKQVICLL